MEEKYKTILESSYKPQKEFAQDIEKYGYSYDPELSSMDTKVFYDPKTNQPEIVYRGSKRVSDWVSNLNLALGGKDKTLDEALETAKKVKEKYGKAPITSGHSRGGYFAEKAGEYVQSPKTVTYNKATMPLDIFKKINPVQEDWRTSGDLVSLPSVLQQGKKRTIKLKKPVNPIEAHGFNYL